MCFHWLVLSPSQCPVCVPLPGYVDREITRDRLPSSDVRALGKEGGVKEKEE